MISVAKLIAALQTLPSEAEVHIAAGPDWDCNTEMEAQIGGQRYLVIDDTGKLYDARGIVK